MTPASGTLEVQKLLAGRESDLALVDLQRSSEYSRRAASTMPMIAIVVSEAPIDVQRLCELGFDDHVCTPFRQSEMLVQLSRYLRARAPVGPAESSGTGAPPAAASMPAPGLDPVALARLAELDPTGENHLIERVLKAFQTSAARLAPQAVAARASHDLDGLRLVAHTLKSSAASIGALHLSQVSAQIEAAIRSGDVDDLPTQLDTLDNALDSALLAIDEQLKGRAA